MKVKEQCCVLGNLHSFCNLPLDMLSLSALEPVVDVQHVKNDWYEKGADLMVVSVYMKGISRDTARVIFREQDFTLFFQTR